MSTAKALQHSRGPRRFHLGYAGYCFWCGKSLAKGQEALFDPMIESVRCVVCEGPRGVDDPGLPGASAQRIYDQRRSAGARVKRSLDNIMDGVAAASIEEPQATRAWAQGAIGERKLEAVLRRLRDVKVLSDRGVPGRANLDFIVVGPPGVFVVDAKLYRGVITFRDHGEASAPDIRLYVNGQDRSHLADEMQWQKDLVRRALRAKFNHRPPVRPVICFVDGTWPIPLPPVEFRGVLLVSERSIRSVVADEAILDAALIARMHHELAIAFPPR